MSDLTLEDSEPIVIVPDVPDEDRLWEMWSDEESLVGDTEMLRIWRDWGKATAPRWNPWVSLYSALTTFGTLLGGRVRGHMGCSPNVYSLIMLPTGGGKMAAYQYSYEFLSRMGMAHMFGPSSLEGMDQELAKRGGDCIWAIDEFHVQLHDWKKAKPTRKSQRNKHFMLEAYSGQPWRGFDPGGDVLIPRPHPNILAMCQPALFSKNMASDLLTNGTLGRFIVFIEQGLRPLKIGVSQMCQMVSEAFPDSLVEMAKERLPDNYCEPGSNTVKISYNPADMQRIEDLAQLIDTIHVGCQTDYVMSACRARDWEKVCKLAIIHSWTKKKDWTKLDYDSFEWAYAVVEKSTRSLINYLYADYVQDPYEKDRRKIVKQCRHTVRTLTYLQHHIRVAGGELMGKKRLIELINVAIAKGELVELKALREKHDKRARRPGMASPRKFIAKRAYNPNLHGALSESVHGKVPYYQQMVRPEGEIPPPIREDG